MSESHAAAPSRRIMLSAYLSQSVSRQRRRFRCRAVRSMNQHTSPVQSHGACGVACLVSVSPRQMDPQRCSFIAVSDGGTPRPFHVIGGSIPVSAQGVILGAYRTRLPQLPRLHQLPQLGVAPDESVQREQTRYAERASKFKLGLPDRSAFVDNSGALSAIYQRIRSRHLCLVRDHAVDPGFGAPVPDDGRVGLFPSAPSSDGIANHHSGERSSISRFLDHPRSWRQHRVARRAFRFRRSRLPPQCASWADASTASVRSAFRVPLLSDQGDPLKRAEPSRSRVCHATKPAELVRKQFGRSAPFSAGSLANRRCLR